MHDVAVALDRVAVGDRYGATRRDPADIVAAEIEQHQMFGPLLGIGEQFASRLAASSAAVRPRGRVPAIGRIVTSPSRMRTRISGLEPVSAKPGRSR